MAVEPQYVPINTQETEPQQRHDVENIASCKYKLVFLVNAIWFVLGVGLETRPWSVVVLTNSSNTMQTFELGVTRFTVDSQTTTGHSHEMSYTSSQCDDYSYYCIDYSRSSTIVSALAITTLLVLGVWLARMMYLLIMSYVYDWVFEEKVYVLQLSMSIVVFLYLLCIFYVITLHLSFDFASKVRVENTRTSHSFTDEVYVLIGCIGGTILLVLSTVVKRRL